MYHIPFHYKQTQLALRNGGNSHTPYHCLFITSLLPQNKEHLNITFELPPCYLAVLKDFTPITFLLPPNHMNIEHYLIITLDTFSLPRGLVN